MKARYIKTIKVIDPDSKGEVELEIYKEDAGGMFAVDGSFLEGTDEPVLSPFGNGTIILCESDGTPQPV